MYFLNTDQLDEMKLQLGQPGSTELDEESIRSSAQVEELNQQLVVLKNQLAEAKTKEENIEIGNMSLLETVDKLQRENDALQGQNAQVFVKVHFYYAIL